MGAALIVVAAAAYFTFGRQIASEAGPPLTSIAVLPFDDMSPGGDQKWLADGMAEELIETLSRIEALRVLARTSAFAMKGKDLRAVGEELRVGSVVEGSVRRAGDQLRVTAQLIRVADGSHLWSARYDRKLSDVFAIQSEIARAIAEAIRGELGVEQEYAWYRSHAPSDVRAYELVKEGFEARWSRGLPTREGLRTAMEYYEQALAIDPDYADAHADLGNAYEELAYFTGKESDRAMARAQAERALALDPTNAGAYHLFAEIHRDRYEWDEARAAAERGVAHNPGHTALRHIASQLLSVQGRTSEALVEMRRVADLDPWFWVFRQNLGLLHILEGDYESAVEDLEQAWRLAPVRAVAEILAYAYHWCGRDEAALEALLRDLPPELAEWGAAVRRGFEEAGFEGSLRASVATRIASRGDACTSYGGNDATLAYLGEADAMFACLERAVDRGIPLPLKTFDVYDPYRSDPRFTELLRRMNLAE